jgi:hypothetical protein
MTTNYAGPHYVISSEPPPPYFLPRNSICSPQFPALNVLSTGSRDYSLEASTNGAACVPEGNQAGAKASERVYNLVRRKGNGFSVFHSTCL